MLLESLLEVWFRELMGVTGMVDDDMNWWIAPLKKWTKKYNLHVVWKNKFPNFHRWDMLGFFFVEGLIGSCFFFFFFGGGGGRCVFFYVLPVVHT